MAYYGLIPLSTNLLAGQSTKTTGNVLQDADSLPTYRIYGPGGVVAGGQPGGAGGGLLASGTMSLRDQGTITNASNATPIVITSASHGLNTGTRVTISGVNGNTAANGTFTITQIDANTFSLNGSAGNGAYTSGGTWHAVGLYVAVVLMDPNLGFLSGQSYWFWTNFTVSGNVQGELSTFTVV